MHAKRIVIVLSCATLFGWASVVLAEPRQRDGQAQGLTHSERMRMRGDLERFSREHPYHDKIEMRRQMLRERATRDRTDIVALDGPLEVRAIIPGRVVEVRVTAGDVVEAGQALLVVEAMKMQNELRAPRSGAVTRVVAAVGSTVEVGDLLLVLG